MVLALACFVFLFSKVVLTSSVFASYPHFGRYFVVLPCFLESALGLRLAFEVLYLNQTVILGHSISTNICPIFFTVRILFHMLFPVLDDHA